MHKLPCFIKSGEKLGQRLSCERFRAPTPEEISLHNQWSEDQKKLVS